MPTVELRYPDAVRCVETDPYETVYQAATRSGAPILTDCLEGACATCKARCTEGDYELIDPSFDALSADEERAGYVLLCQMEARGSCTVEMPYTLAFASNAQPRTVACVVQEIAPVGASIVRLRIEAAVPFDFVPGQYAQVQVPGTNFRRAYSFANEPGECTAEFYVRLLEGGVMSGYLHGRAQPGDEVQIELPFGGFYLRPGTGPLVAVSGGTGLAPILSMLTQFAQCGAGREVHVLHGARAPDDLFGLDAIRAMGGDAFALSLHLAVEDNATGELHAGQVTELLTPELLGTDGTDVYLCGPPPMVSCAEARLAQFGVPTARVFAERFNPA